MAQSITVAEAVPLFLRSRQERNLRPLTLDGYQYWSASMLRERGNDPLRSFHSKKIVEAVKQHGASYGMMIQCFLRWAIAEKLVSRDHDIGSLPKPPRSDDREISFLSPEHAQVFLENVTPKYRAAFVLALYAGMRPYECARIHWDAIHLGEKRIRISGSVSKIRRPRIIEGVPHILWRLLRSCAGDGRVVPAEKENHAIYRIIHERKRVAELTGVPLAHDIFRHTFATYYTALTGHPAMCAKILGHYKLHTLAAHYDGVATRSQARRYFDLPIEFAKMARRRKTPKALKDQE